MIATEALRDVVLNALDELKAKDVHVLDVRDRTSITDIMVIASGTSARHVKSLADVTAEYAKKAGVMPLGMEGEREGEWALVDLGDVVVHIMQPRVRDFYNLEKLWSVSEGGDADAEHNQEDAADTAASRADRLR